MLFPVIVGLILVCSDLALGQEPVAAPACPALLRCVAAPPNPDKQQCQADAQQLTACFATAMNSADICECSPAFAYQYARVVIKALGSCKLRSSCNTREMIECRGKMQAAMSPGSWSAATYSEAADCMERASDERTDCFMQGSMLEGSHVGPAVRDVDVEVLRFVAKGCNLLEMQRECVSKSSLSRDPCSFGVANTEIMGCIIKKSAGARKCTNDVPELIRRRGNLFKSAADFQCEIQNRIDKRFAQCSKRSLMDSFRQARNAFSFD